MKFLGALMVLALAASAAAQDGGKLDWKGKEDDPQLALADAKTRSKPALLFFTSKGCKYCRLLSEGAFSDQAVVDAAKPFVCVFVECDWGFKNVELARRFKVTGYPVVVVCNPQGEDAGVIQSRTAPELAQELKDSLAKFAPVPEQPAPERLNFQDYSPLAVTLARDVGRLLLVYFYDDSPGSLSMNRAIIDAHLKDLRNRFVPVKCEFRKDSDVCTGFDVNRAPTILVLNPTLQKPMDAPVAKIVGSRSARELRRDLEDAISSAQNPPEKVPVAVAPLPAVSPKAAREEPLSDDEAERRFILARMSVALDMSKHGKREKAIDVLEDVVQSFPKHVVVKEAKALLDQLKK